MIERQNPTIFYSWQSDLKSGANHAFIEEALNLALRALASDASVITPDRDMAPQLDQATAGIPGAPDIPATILAKIEHASAVIADVSIINGLSSISSYRFNRPTRLRQQIKGILTPRLTPNPNVLVEVGYAMKALGPENLIMVRSYAVGGGSARLSA